MSLDIPTATFFDGTNRVLVNNGQTPIASTADMDANTILKEQLQAKNTFQEMHTQILRGVRAYWLMRYYTIVGVIGQQRYDFLTAPTVFQPSSGTNIQVPTSPENIVEKSFTVIDSVGMKRSEPRNISYAQWRRELYTPAIVNGPPNFWFMLPPDGDGNLDIAFHPPPDQTYNINFQAYMDPITLINSTDTIQFPPKHQNILWQYASKYFQLVLAEGQEPTVAAWLDPMMSELRLLTRGPTEEMTGVDIGIRLRSGFRRRGPNGCDIFHDYDPG